MREGRTNKRWTGILIPIVSVTMLAAFFTGVLLWQSRNKDVCTKDCLNCTLEGLDKNCVMIGDSYGVNYIGVSGEGWTGWVDTFCVLYPEITAYTSAVGGSGFIGGVEETFEVQLDRLIIEVEDGTTVTDLIVVGGYNDVSMGWPEAELDGAVANFTEKTRKAFPNARISLIYASKDFASAGMQNRLADYEDIFSRICERHGMVYVANAEKIIDHEQLMFWDENDANSGFHPNTMGNRKIAVSIARYLVGDDIIN